MTHIALIGCSKTKLGSDTPEKLFKAQDIYQGNTFLKAKNEGVARFGCEDFHILSAKFGLLNKDDEIAYYDMYLGKQSTSYKKEWIAKVLSALRTRYDLQNTKFYIFAGSDYYKDLVSHLNCVVFAYKSSNTINLDNSTEYMNGGK